MKRGSEWTTVNSIRGRWGFCGDAIRWVKLSGGWSCCTSFLESRGNDSNDHGYGYLVA
jgi:hypothetical protein